MKEKESRSFLDGCHRYGWLLTLIGLIITGLMNLSYIAYSYGRIEQNMSDVRDRVGRLERSWDLYLREVRGIESPKQ